MSEKEEEFPFEDFVEALSEEADLRPSMKGILKAVAEKNMYEYLELDTGSILRFRPSLRS